MEKRTVNLSGEIKADLYICDVLIVGSGAAGLCCADRLFDAGITDVAIITSELYGGTSHSSGSDKQTYYKVSVCADTPDSPIEMAHSLFDGGAMHGDIAYIESVCSLQAFYRLIECGVPFPHNQYGAYVGYKTDHDPRQRATSAGPRTSKYMHECLLKRVQTKKIPIFERMTAVKISTAEEDENEICGVIAISTENADAPNLGITLFAAGSVVLATGGPGELYSASVYPQGQVSMHGVALDAGAKLANLGEVQFGITSVGFRWNLSGTYQQVLPSYFSVDSRGNRHNFLTNYYPNTSQLASNIFLKGYQWPFTGARASGFGSSLIDIAVQAEISAGRRVFLDYTRNPAADGTLDISKLAPEAKEYLTHSGAVQQTPYQRLSHMNPEAIEIYASHGIDLLDPLEIAVSFQHCNGGVDVDSSYSTNIAGLYAIGEIAGAHGVSRPGGSALNSGQVGALRVSQAIARNKPNHRVYINRLQEDAQQVYNRSIQMLQSNAPGQAKVRKEIQAQMTQYAGFLRRPEQVSKALSEAKRCLGKHPGAYMSAGGQSELAEAWESVNLYNTRAAFLESIDHYIDTGGGSRGAYLILDDGPNWIDTASGRMLAHRAENPHHRSSRVIVCDHAYSEPVRPIPEDNSWFESIWAEFKQHQTGNIQKAK